MILKIKRVIRNTISINQMSIFGTILLNRVKIIIIYLYLSLIFLNNYIYFNEMDRSRT